MRHNKFSTIKKWGIVSLISLVLVSCGSDAAMQEFNDSGKLSNLDTDALVISMPDGFSNIAAKCVGTDLVYSAMNTNGRAIAVSSEHPWCSDGILTNLDTRN